MNLRTNIPVLIDFDGVIKLGDKPAPDAKEFLNFLEIKKIPSIIISNSTLRTSKEIKEFLTHNKIQTNIPSITAVDATLAYVKKRYKNVSVYCSPEIKNLFNGFKDSDSPEAVIVGDLGEEWSHKNLNEIFRKVYSGAELIAMQRNRFWKPDGKTLTLDAGAYISGIEYATLKEAILIGKPSPLYFHMAIDKLGFKEKFPFIMIGDDLESDIYSAQNIGGIGILIFTGKTTSPLSKGLKFTPDYTAHNLKEIISLLEKKQNVEII